MVRLLSRLARPALAAALAVSLTASLAPRPAAAEHEYVVVWGDTLSHLAERFGLTVQQLVWMNGIEDPDLIITGQVLLTGNEHLLQGGPQPSAEPEPVEAVADAPEEAVIEAVDEEGEVEPLPVELPPAFDRELVRELLIDAAHRYGWDPNLILAQAWQESLWKQDEISWTGAIGVMQLMPDTAQEMEDWYFGHEMDVWYSAYDNIEVGVAYLTVLYEVTGSVELALASYYQGWGSVQRDGFFPDTEEYVERIFMFQEMFASGQLP